METVVLMGAEDVRAAGRSIASSAETMKQAAASIHETIHFGLRSLEELVYRLEALKKGEDDASDNRGDSKAE